MKDKYAGVNIDFDTKFMKISISYKWWIDNTHISHPCNRERQF